jgi:hypothetical protein
MLKQAFLTTRIKKLMFMAKFRAVNSLFWLINFHEKGSWHAFRVKALTALVFNQ